MYRYPTCRSCLFGTSRPALEPDYGRIPQDVRHPPSQPHPHLGAAPGGNCHGGCRVKSMVDNSVGEKLLLPAKENKTTEELPVSDTYQTEEIYTSDQLSSNIQLLSYTTTAAVTATAAQDTITLDDYLGNLFCTGCHKHCSLLAPQCSIEWHRRSRRRVNTIPFTCRPHRSRRNLLRLQKHPLQRKTPPHSRILPQRSPSRILRRATDAQETAANAGKHRRHFF